MYLLQPVLLLFVFVGHNIFDVIIFVFSEFYSVTLYHVVQVCCFQKFTKISVYKWELKYITAMLCNVAHSNGVSILHYVIRNHFGRYFFKNEPIFEKKGWTIVHAFFQKMAQKSPQIFITFSDIY